MICTMLYYLHGYQSSPNSSKGVLFKKTLHAIPIEYRQTAPEHLVISDCLRTIASVIHKDTSVQIIGSSLGGFLAASTALTHATVQHLILLNPAIIPPSTDLSTIHDIPQRIIREMIDPRLFEQKIPSSITILRGTNDTVVPDEWILTFAKAQEATLFLLQDDHRFTKNIESLPQIIKDILHRL